MFQDRSPPFVVMLHSDHRKVQCSTPATFVVGIRRYVVGGCKKRRNAC